MPGGEFRWLKVALAWIAATIMAGLVAWGRSPPPH